MLGLPSRADSFGGGDPRKKIGHTPCRARRSVVYTFGPFPKVRASLLMDVEQLLTQVSPASPCGEDVSDHPEFYELKGAISVEGPSLVPGGKNGGADWPKARQLAPELLKRGKDLRVAIWLTTAELNRAGVAGLRDGLAVIHGLLERYWGALYPELGDNGEVIARMNTFAELCHPEYSPVVGMLQVAPLVELRPFGAVRYRDFLIARGDTTAREDEKVLPSGEIEAVFNGCPLEELSRASATVAECLKLAKDIDALLTDKAGQLSGPDLKPLTSTLAGIDQLLRERLALREPNDTASGDSANGQSEQPATNGAAPAAARANGMVQSRNDVIRVLDQICEWYAKHEPSSPVPILLNRAKRAVPLSFIELIDDLAPAGSKEIKALRGPEA